MPSRTEPTARPVRLVQIEPLSSKNKSMLTASTRNQLAPQPLTDIKVPPIPSDWWVYRKKAKATALKVAGYFYTTHSYGATRRWLLSFLPDRIVYRWKPYQRGECNRCGLCCKLIFKCPFFYEDGHTTACMVYTSKHAVPACVNFPADPIDLREVQKEAAPSPCPFYYEGQPEHLTTWSAVKAEVRLEIARRVDKLKEAFNF
jgi:hypothetical protein